MARNGVRVGNRSSSFGPRRTRAWGMAVGVLVLSMGAGWTPCARGSGIFRDLTARDRSQPIVLSQAGEVIPLHSAGRAGSLLASGTVPAYLAFPLHGGEHLPAHVPKLATGPPPGESVVGPLDLTPAAQSQLNADLIASRFAIVNTPGQSYAIAFLPRYARALSHEDSTPASTSTSTSASAPASTSPSTGTTGIGSMLGLNTPAADWSINGIPASELSQWIQTGTKEISHLTSLGVDGVAKTLGIKATPTASGLNLQPQYLVPPAAEASTAPLPVPAPEPSAWLICALILGTAGLRQFVRQRCPIARA